MPTTSINVISAIPVHRTTICSSWQMRSPIHTQGRGLPTSCGENRNDQAKTQQVALFGGTCNNPREHTNDTKSHPTTELLQRVLNTSPVRHTEYWCNTCSVWRECTNTSVTNVTCESSISANPSISSERKTCPVPQSCTAGSDDKKIGLQKHAYGVQTWQKNTFYINGESSILVSSSLILFELLKSSSEFFLIRHLREVHCTTAQEVRQ